MWFYDDAFWNLEKIDLNKTFVEIFPNADDFATAFDSSPFVGKVDTKDIKFIYALLFGKYAHSTIANEDENQFKMRMFSLIYQHAPYWLKQREIQDSLRALTLDDIKNGAMSINRHAYNPSTIVEGGANPTGESIDTVDEQNTNKYIKGTSDAYAIWSDLLSRDITEEFLNKFKKLFRNILIPKQESKEVAQ